MSLGSRKGGLAAKIGARKVWLASKVFSQELDSFAKTTQTGHLDGREDFAGLLCRRADCTNNENKARH
jgi:hypothetical protein